MKTNHGRQFVARQDFRPGWSFPKQGFKAATNRGMRTAHKRSLDAIRQGIDPDGIVFAVRNEVEDKWGWD